MDTRLSSLAMSPSSAGMVLFSSVNEAKIKYPIDLQFQENAQIETKDAHPSLFVLHLSYFAFAVSQQFEITTCCKVCDLVTHTLIIDRQ